MSPLKPPSLPPACAECQTVTQAAKGGAPQQSASQVFRASDGKMRIDAGNISVITDPKALQSIVLDHLTKEARILPMQPALPGAPPLGAPPSFAPKGAPALPTTPAMAVQELGKQVIGGLEAEGKRYTIPPPIPKLPSGQMPQVPGMPQQPAPPKPGQMPTIAEVWTSTKLGLPVLTKMTGAFGQLTTACKAAPIAEPHPSLFQIPAGYKPVLPAVTPPKL